MLVSGEIRSSQRLLKQRKKNLNDQPCRRSGRLPGGYDDIGLPVKDILPDHVA
jgi:hypothetical protein